VRSPAVFGLALIAIVGGVAIGVLAGSGIGSAGPSPGNSGLVAVIGSTPPSQEPGPEGSSASPPAASGSPGASPSPSPSPAPTSLPTPALVPAPLTGQLVSPAAAARHPIAVMIDDLFPARPQSGFSAASIVWQAPAEGGIPRYMLVFQENIPTDVGPVRSSRYYYIAWAAELKAVYAHSGGSPQALATLRAKGNGQLVYNADEFRWGGSFHRISTRFSPHNLYTTGKQLRGIATAQGAKDGPIAWPWTFAPDLAYPLRPTGGRIQVAYLANSIRYDYDRATNTYFRSVTGEKKQIDAATRQRVAPKNVVIMLMSFAPLNDGSQKHRLEATVVGSGTAWIATNGTTIRGTWKKTALTSPTRFFDGAGKTVVLTVGQTFVQVMQNGTKVGLTAGTPPVSVTHGIGPAAS